MKPVIPSEKIVYLSENGHHEARVTDVIRGHVFLKWRPLGAKRWTHTSMKGSVFKSSGWREWREAPNKASSMKPDWRKCSMLSAGDKRAVKQVEEILDFGVFKVSDEAIRHTVGLLKTLAARVAELEKGGKRE